MQGQLHGPTVRSRKSCGKSVGRSSTNCCGTKWSCHRKNRNEGQKTQPTPQKACGLIEQRAHQGISFRGLLPNRSPNLPSSMERDRISQIKVELTRLPSFRRGLIRFKDHEFFTPHVSHRRTPTVPIMGANPASDPAEKAKITLSEST